MDWIARICDGDGVRGWMGIGQADGRGGERKGKEKKKRKERKRTSKNE
jgi:hypothetical protein